MGAINLKLKDPHTGMRFIGSIVVDDKEWVEVEITGLSAHLSGVIISSLNSGLIKADRPNAEIIAGLSAPKSIREMEITTRSLGMNCCCMNTLMFNDPRYNYVTGSHDDFLVEYHRSISSEIVEYRHTATNWEIFSDENYIDKVFSSYNNETDLLTMAGSLPVANPAYYVRAQFVCEEYRTRWSVTSKILDV